MAKNGLLKMVKNGLLSSYILSYINIFKIDQRSSFQGNNSWSFFLAKYVQGGKGAMKLTLCKAPTRETRPDHYTGNSVPYSLRQVGSLTSPADYIKLKMWETEPTIYCPYPRRLEHLTICRCHCKGSMFSSWVLVRSGARTRDLPHSSSALN